MKYKIFLLYTLVTFNIQADVHFASNYTNSIFLEPPLPILPPFFDWKTVGGPGTQYELQVAFLTDVFFQFPVIDIDGIIDSSYQLTMQNVLMSFTSYRWRVRAKSGHESSEYSPVFIFITFK